jgi:hypothetical protein
VGLKSLRLEPRLGVKELSCNRQVSSTPQKQDIPVANSNFITIIPQEFA